MRKCMRNKTKGLNNTYLDEYEYDFTAKKLTG